jgi:hypothetical protein
MHASKNVLVVDDDQEPWVTSFVLESEGFEVAKAPRSRRAGVALTATRRMEVPGATGVLHEPIDLGSLLRVVERHARGAG